MIRWLKRIWRRLLDWLVPVEPVFIPRLPLPALPEPDWFVWESEQIQRLGYVFWFDHWRYEGEPGAYPEPTKAQRDKVFAMSARRAAERHGSMERVEALDRITTLHLIETGFSDRPMPERVRIMGQDPVRWSMEIAEGKRRLN